MKRPVLLIACLVAASVQAQVEYRFDSNAQGWRRANFSLTSLALTDLGPAQWNSAGYLQADDFSDYAFHLSPDLGGLDLSSAYGTPLTFDYSTVGAGGLAGEPFVVLTDGAAAIFHGQTFTRGGNFASYTLNLSPSNGWLYGTSLVDIAPATEAQMRSVLGGLTRIGVTADLADGADFTRLDNVRIAAVPEPASLAILGLGSLALLRRRRAR